MCLTKKNALRGEASKFGSIYLQHLGEGIDKTEGGGRDLRRRARSVGWPKGGSDRPPVDTAICYTSGSAIRRLT